MLAGLVVFCLLMTAYAYFGYPAVLACLQLFLGRPVVLRRSDEPLPSLAVIITVRNEQQVVALKLDQSLALRYCGQTVEQHLAERSGLIELIVASDASDDETDAIVESYADRGVRLVRLPERGGKETAQRAAIESVKAELVVFTDAKIQLNENALDNFAAYFADESVGAVSSTDRVLTDAGGGSGEGFYVRYEMRLRRLETSVNSLVGLSGSCFAVRKSVADHIRTDIPSDFALLLEAQRQKLRGVHASDVIGAYKAVRTEQEEFRRKIRTVLRGITALFACSEVLNPAKYGMFSWQVFSHKLCRWLVPWFLLTALIGSFVLASSSLFFGLLLAGQLLFYGAAAAAYFNPDLQRYLPAKVPLFFSIVNLAIAWAWIKYFSGQRSVSWTPSAKVS